MTCNEAVKLIEMNTLAKLDDLCPGEGYYIYTKTIAKGLGIPKAWVSTALKSLRDQGLVEYKRGLMDEDGEGVRGSGYGLTEKGRKLMEEL